MCFDSVNLIEAAHFNKGNAQSLLQVIGSGAGLGIEDKVKIGLSHFLKGVIVGTGADLADLPDAGLTKNIEEFTSCPGCCILRSQGGYLSGGFFLSGRLRQACRGDCCRTPLQGREKSKQIDR